MADIENIEAAQYSGVVKIMLKRTERYKVNQNFTSRSVTLVRANYVRFELRRVHLSLPPIVFLWVIWSSSNKQTIKQKIKSNLTPAEICAINY